jgi:hypothetical protein
MTEPVNVGEIAVPIVADASGLKSGLDGAKKSTLDFRKVAETALGFGLGSILTKAGSALFQFAKKGRQDFLIASAGITVLENNARRFGDTTVDLRGKIDNYGKSLEALTKFTGEQAVDSTNSLIIFTKDLTQAMVLNNIAADVATATGKDLNVVADMLGRAFSGDERAMLQLNKQFGLSQKEGKGLAETLTEIETKFSGAAKATDKAAQEAKSLDDAWGNLGETIGEKLGPAASGFSRFFKGIARDLSGLLGDGLAQSEGLVEAYEKMLSRVDSDLQFAKSEGVRQRLLTEREKILASLSAEKAKRDEILSAASNETEENKKARLELQRKLKALDEEKRIRDEIADGMAQVDAMIERATKAENEKADQHQRNLDEANRLLEEQEAKFEAIGSTMANVQANEMQTYFTALKEGTMQGSQALEQLGRAFLKSTVSALGDGLIQEGAAYTAKAIAALISVVNAPAAPGLFGAGASLAAAGGGIKAVAAGLNQGGVTVGGNDQFDTIPTLLRKNEIVAPLDDPRAMAQVRKAAGGGDGGGSINLGGMVFNGVKDARDAAGMLGRAAREVLSVIDGANRRKGARSKRGG